MKNLFKSKSVYWDLSIIFLMPLVWWIMNSSFNQRMSQEDLIDQITLLLLIVLIIRGAKVRKKTNSDINYFFVYGFISLVLTVIVYTFYNLKLSLFLSSLTISFLALGVIYLLFFQKPEKD